MKENWLAKEKEKIVPEEKKARLLELGGRRKHKNEEENKNKGKGRKIKAFKGFPKNQDTIKPNASSRNVPTSS